MFRALKFLVWTGCAVGLGIYVSTLDVQGKSTVSHLQRFWKQQVSGTRLSSFRTKLGEAWDDSKEPAVRPKEHHSTEDRDAVNKLIATHGQQKE